MSAITEIKKYGNDKHLVVSITEPVRSIKRTIIMRQSNATHVLSAGLTNKNYQPTDFTVLNNWHMNCLN